MQKIWQEAEALQTELVERRRDLHRHPETGWTEFRSYRVWGMKFIWAMTP